MDGLFIGPAVLGSIGPSPGGENPKCAPFTPIRYKELPDLSRGKPATIYALASGVGSVFGGVGSLEYIRQASLPERLHRGLIAQLGLR